MREHLRSDYPADLGPAGLGLWTRFIPAFELDEREREVLTLAARTADDVAALERVVAEDGTDMRARAELRQTRAALRVHLGALHLPVDERPMDAKQLRSKAAADARWSRTKRTREERRGA